MISKEKKRLTKFSKKKNFFYFDLLYSNSICKQSSIPTSILILLFISGYCDNCWTHISRSDTVFVKRLMIVKRRKYLEKNFNQFFFGKDFFFKEYLNLTLIPT
jgi:hypothetical protein